MIQREPVSDDTPTTAPPAEDNERITLAQEADRIMEEDSEDSSD